MPVKIALIFFQQAAMQTNEGQKTMADLQKKYKPKQDAMQTLATEVDNQRKQLQAAPATMTDADKAKMAADIDGKEKQLQLDQENLNSSSQADLQEAYSKIADRFSQVAEDYAQKNGFNLLVDAGSQASTVMWVSSDAHIDITMAVIDAFNAQSGAVAPAAPAPAAARPKAPASTTPHPAAPKAPAK